MLICFVDCALSFCKVTKYYFYYICFYTSLIFVVCYYILRPTIGLNDSKYKYVNNQNKLGIFVDSDVFPCVDFSGPDHGFCFTDFKDIIEKTVPDNHSIGK